jgi:hypothetical protein
MSCTHNKKKSRVRNGFSPKIWGPPLWTVLHIMAQNYSSKPTVTDKNHFRTFIVSLTHVLPCGVCRKNFQKHMNIKDLQIALGSRDTLVKFIYNLHCNIGHFKVPLKKLEATYEKMRARKNKKVNYRIIQQIIPVDSAPDVPSFQFHQ